MAVYFRLRALIEQKEALTDQKITYRMIASETGVSTNTLTKMAQQKLTQIGLVTLDKLCDYFECQPGDIMYHKRDNEADQ